MRPPPPGRGEPALNLPPTTRYLLLVIAALGALDWLVGGQLAYLMVFPGFAPTPWVVVSAFTSAFVHASFAHLALNLFALAIFGSVLEPRIGGRWLLALFAAGAVVGPLTHSLFDPAPVLGASAANGALAGTGLLLAQRHQLGRHGPLMMIFAGIFLLTSLVGFVAPFGGQIADAAHLGGFVVGLLLATRIRVVRRLPFA
ncbi:MAG: rhomboid family intramembrane serine protease [Alphaproteobacteria bacterium]